MIEYQASLKDKEQKYLEERGINNHIILSLAFLCKQMNAM